jgi:hypothetical protein
MKIVPIAFLTFLSLLSYACSDAPTPQPMVVHVFRDRTSKELNLALIAAGEKQLTTSHGRPIMIATLENTYTDVLAEWGHRTNPDLVIFDSLEDAKKVNVDVPPQSVVQISGKQYFLVVLPGTAGEQQEAAQLVLSTLRQELQKSGSNTSIR